MDTNGFRQFDLYLNIYRGRIPGHMDARITIRYKVPNVNVSHTTHKELDDEIQEGCSCILE